MKIEGDLRSPRGSFQLFLRDPNDEENKIIKSIKTSLQTEPRHFFKNFIVTDEEDSAKKKETFDVSRRIYKPEFIQEYAPFSQYISIHTKGSHGKT